MSEKRGLARRLGVGASTRLASDALRAMAGPRGSTFITLAIIISTFGITNCFILTGPRVYFVMAEKKMFLPLAGRLHPRFRTPHYSILLQSVWASALLLTNSYGRLLQYVTFGDWIFFGLTALALLALRRKMPGAERPYKAWGYPAAPLLFFAVSAAVVVNVLVSTPLQSAVGTAIILSGLPLFFYYRSRESKETA